MVLGNYSLCIEACIGDVAFQAIPFLILADFILADIDLYVLADFKKLVISAPVDLRLGTAFFIFYY